MASEAYVDVPPAPDDGMPDNRNRRRRRRGGKRRWPPRVGWPADAEVDAAANSNDDAAIDSADNDSADNDSPEVECADTESRDIDSPDIDRAEAAPPDPDSDVPAGDDWLDTRLAAALQRLDGDGTATAEAPVAPIGAEGGQVEGDGTVDPELIRLLRGLDATIDTARHVLYAAAQVQAQYSTAVEPPPEESPAPELPNLPDLPELPEMLPPPPTAEHATRATPAGRPVLYATLAGTVAVLGWFAWHLHINPSAGLDIGQAVASIAVPSTQTDGMAAPADDAEVVEAVEAPLPSDSEAAGLAEAVVILDIAEPETAVDPAQRAPRSAQVASLAPAEASAPDSTPADADSAAVPIPFDGASTPEPAPSAAAQPRLASAAGGAAAGVAGAIEHTRGAADSGALAAPVRGPVGEPLALPLPLPAHGQETELSVMIQGAPEPVRLSAGRRAGADTWILTAEQTEGLTLSAPADFGPRDFALDVTLVTSDGRIPQAYSIAVALDPAEARTAVVEPAALEARAAAPSESVPSVPETPGTAPHLPAEPTDSGAASGESPAATPEPLEPEVENRLLERGAELLAQGDASAARLIYEHAARRGSAPAMLALGRSYDPDFLAKAGIRGIKPDTGQATAWYERAARASDR